MYRKAQHMRAETGEVLMAEVNIDYIARPCFKKTKPDAAQQTWDPMLGRERSKGLGCVRWDPHP